MDSPEFSQKIIGVFTTSDNLKTELIKMYSSLKFKANFSFNLIDGGNFKKKMSKANKLNCYGSLILGEDEWKEKKIIWKNFRTGNQENISINNVNNFLEQIC